MTLSKFDIYSFRNITSASIEPCSGINLIIGENASGKSSFLEAVYILGRACSFRATNLKQVIQFNQTEFIVAGECLQGNSSLYKLGIQFNGKKCDIRINQENKFKADLAYSLPVLLIHPKSYKLLDAGAQIRREFMDWGVFNNEEKFLTNWRKFKKALQQRNALLKSKQVSQLDVWNTEIVQYGTIVSKYRKQYLENLEPFFFEICHYFLDFKTIEIKYLFGWDKDVEYKQTLIDDLQKDLRYGFTHSGPHRGDFQLNVDSRTARNFVSRGQLKLLMLALKLAQIRLINTEKNNQVCVLIDDLTAELDVPNKQKLLAYLNQLNCQVFMSTTELSNFGDLTQLENYKVFHVEHGKIQTLDLESCFT